MLGQSTVGIGSGSLGDGRDCHRSSAIHSWLVLNYLQFQATDFNGSVPPQA